MSDLTRRQVLQFGGRIGAGLAIAPCASLLFTHCSGGSSEYQNMKLFDENHPQAKIETLRLTVVYDNMSYASGLTADWGFACLVQGLEQTLLFDSGRFDFTFMSNLSKLGIDPQRIACALLSHEHQDHVGGLPRLLQTQNAMKVFVPGSISSGYKKLVKRKGVELVEMDHPGIVCANAASTGEMRSVVKNEHALVLRTDNGAIVVTGCAHPGILDIVHRVRDMTKQDILLVMGGFHLMHDHARSIQKIIDGFQQLGVRFVAPSHCTGEQALKLFAGAYGKRFIRSGVGRVITADDLVASA